MASIENTTIFPPSPAMERGKSYVLGADPKGKNFLYTNTKGVIIRDIENPKNCDVYTKHVRKVCTAQYAPSGFYICSGDASGTVKIWDTLDKEHIMKNEYRPITGAILDISWGPENKRLAVTGEGASKESLFGKVILAETGSNVGELIGIRKAGNSVSFRQCRPYRVAVGDEFKVGVYEGPPFKQKHSLEDHSRFVNSVRYSPDGKYLATASSDGHVFLYDGESSKLLGQLGDEKKGAHSGGIYSISWSPDSKELLTVSGDKSAKIWNVEARQEVVQIVIGKNMEDQQYASLWMGNHLLSVSLSGYINYLDRNDPCKPLKVLRGHSKPITQVIVVPGETAVHVTGDTSGSMLKWDTESGDADAFLGQGHTSRVVTLLYDHNNKEILSAGEDDKIRFTSFASVDFNAGTTISLDSQPKAMCLVDNGYLVLNCDKAIVLYKDKKKVFELAHCEKFTPTGFAAHGTTVAVEAEKSCIKIYNIESDALVDSGIAINVREGADVMAFSPDGSKLAVGTKRNYIQIHEVTDNYKLAKDLIGHHSRPTCLSWSPDGLKLASSSMDSSLRVWNIATRKNGDIQGAHTSAFVTDIAWLDDNRILTVGDDCLTKQWAVTW